MKKTIAALTTLLILVCSTGFAAPPNDNVNQRAQATFTEKFTNAKQVSWNRTDKYVKASFLLNDQYFFAYFDETGDLLGISRNITSNQLPISLGTALKNFQQDGWITELFEFAGENETTYYATVESAEKIIMIKTVGNDAWTVYKKIKKN